MHSGTVAIKTIDAPEFSGYRMHSLATSYCVCARAIVRIYQNVNWRRLKIYLRCFLRCLACHAKPDEPMTRRYRGNIFEIVRHEVYDPPERHPPQANLDGSRPVRNPRRSTRLDSLFSSLICVVATPFSNGHMVLEMIVTSAILTACVSEQYWAIMGTY